jgi:hypothetical protein
MTAQTHHFRNMYINRARHEEFERLVGWARLQPGGRPHSNGKALSDTILDICLGVIDLHEGRVSDASVYVNELIKGGATQ